jgi:hypothetical protein
VRAHVAGKPEKESLRGEKGISTYTVQESESPDYSADVRAHVAGKTGKGIIERRGGIINLYCTRV